MAYPYFNPGGAGTPANLPGPNPQPGPNWEQGIYPSYNRSPQGLSLEPGMMPAGRPDYFNLQLLPPQNAAIPLYLPSPPPMYHGNQFPPPPEYHGNQYLQPPEHHSNQFQPGPAYHGNQFPPAPVYYGNQFPPTPFVHQPQPPMAYPHSPGFPYMALPPMLPIPPHLQQAMPRRPYPPAPAKAIERSPKRKPSREPKPKGEMVVEISYRKMGDNGGVQKLDETAIQQGRTVRKGLDK